MLDPQLVAGLVIVALTWVFIFLVYKAILKVAEWTLTARDALRDRYGDSRWQPHVLDIALLPTWLAIELFCLVAAIVMGLLLMWTVISTANSLRDWWHEGRSAR